MGVFGPRKTRITIYKLVSWLKMFIYKANQTKALATKLSVRSNKPSGHGKINAAIPFSTWRGRHVVKKDRNSCVIFSFRINKTYAHSL